MQTPLFIAQNISDIRSSMHHTVVLLANNTAYGCGLAKDAFGDVNASLFTSLIQIYPNSSITQIGATIHGTSLVSNLNSDQILTSGQDESGELGMNCSNIR